MENQIAVQTENIMDQAKGKVFCTKNIESLEERKELLNVLEGDMPLLNDCVGQEINLKDIYVEEGIRIDDETGESKVKYRTILFDESGQTYATGSYGIYNILKKFLSLNIFVPGGEAVKVEVAKRSIGNGKSSLTLKLK